MKAIRMRIQKNSRPLAILLAAVVATISTVVVANATQTITTPNAAFIPFNLAASANSAAITPASNRSVLVMGCHTEFGAQGVGQVSLLQNSGLIAWVGLESSDGAITHGISTTAGTHIVFIDNLNKVDIQTASADTIRVHNGYTTTQTGNVTLIW